MTERRELLQSMLLWSQSRRLALPFAILREYDSPQSYVGNLTDSVISDRWSELKPAEGQFVLLRGSRGRVQDSQSHVYRFYASV